MAAQDDIQGGVPRRTVVEMFTATWCTNCPAADQAVEELAAQLGDSITLIEYHPQFGSPQDPFGAAETDQRFSFYGVTAPPVFICDGVARVAGAVPNLLSEYRSAASGRLAKKSPVSITLSGGLQGGSATYQVRVESKVDRPLENLRLVLVVTEDSIVYAAPNGVGLHRHVARDFEPDPQGYNASLISLGYVSYGGTIPLDPSWNQQRLGLAALLQDQGTGEVLQSAWVKLFQAVYALQLTAADTLLDGQAGGTAAFPFTIINTGNVGDSVIIDLPPSLLVPDTLVASICDRLFCYPVPFARYLAAGDSLTGLEVHVIPSSPGRSTAVLTVTPQSSPSSGVAARFHVEVP